MCSLNWHRVKSRWSMIRRSNMNWKHPLMRAVCRSHRWTAVWRAKRTSRQVKPRHPVLLRLHSRQPSCWKPLRKASHAFFSMDIGTNIDGIISMDRCPGHARSKWTRKQQHCWSAPSSSLSSELCSASVRTFGERVVRRNDDHLHGRTLRVDPQQEFLSRLKKRAAEDTVTIPRIYDEELARSVDEHSPDIRSHLPSFSSVKSTLYRHRQRGQRNQASKGIKTEPTADCKSSAGHPTGWNTLPPKKRPLTVNVDCLPTPSPSSCCSSSSYSHLSSESHQAEKRRKHSSSSSTTTTTTAPATTTFTEENHQNNNAHMAVAAALESQQLIAKFLSNPYNLLLAQNYFAKYSTSFADNPHFMLMHAYALVLSSLQQQQQPLMWYSLFLLLFLLLLLFFTLTVCQIIAPWLLSSVTLTLLLLLFLLFFFFFVVVDVRFPSIPLSPSAMSSRIYVRCSRFSLFVCLCVLDF